MKDVADSGEGPGMDPQDAAVIMQQARERATRELTINRAVIFITWAVVYLIGDTVIWLSVRGQHPYAGPPGICRRRWACLPCWPWLSP
jgi:hypothetical protein